MTKEKGLYNDRLKAQFLDYIKEKFKEEEKSEKNLLSYENTLRKAAEIEKKYDKDIYEMNSELAAEVMKKQSSTSYTTIYGRKRCIADYLEFCKTVGLFVTDAFDNMEVDSLDKIIEENVFGVEDLARLLDLAFPPIEDNDASVIFRVGIWMIWMGIDKNAMFNVKVDDVDLHYCKLNAMGKTYDIPIEAYAAFEKAVEATEFVNKARKKEQGVMRDRYPGDQLLRAFTKLTFNGFKISVRKAWTESERFKEEGQGRKLYLNGIKNSGTYFRILEAGDDVIKANDILNHHIYDTYNEETKEMEYKLANANTRNKARYFAKRNYRGWLRAYNKVNGTDYQSVWVQGDSEE